MRILITTGIYPPQIGGPAQYAKNMFNLWSEMGHKVSVKVFSRFNFLSTGVRHLIYFLYILPAVLKADFIFTLDTFSVALPSVLAARMLGKKIIIRTGGDFLWEGYIERTGDLVLLRDFYKTRMDKFSIKEKVILYLTKWTLNHADLLVFSTNWQKDIFFEPYNLNKNKIAVVENHYDKKEQSSKFESGMSVKKYFIAGTRPLGWKNVPFLKKIFESEEIKSKMAFLDIKSAPYDEFMGKISKAYAVILVSLGDISPHIILDAINLNKPFILTEECGILDRVGDVSLTVNPKNENDIKEKILWLLNEENYRKQVEKIKNFSFTHTWEEIAREYLILYKSIK